jgi:hypothetical protein
VQEEGQEALGFRGQEEVQEEEEVAPVRLPFLAL